MSRYPPVAVKVWGEWACFTRPEMKVERVSYPVPTASAARGILEAIFWKPEFRWSVEEVWLLEPIRYHSLVVDPASLPDELEVTATTEDGVVMGLRHRDLDVEGVQFHPESILTMSGHDMLRNFLDRAGTPAGRD